MYFHANRDCKNGQGAASIGRGVRRFWMTSSSSGPVRLVCVAGRAHNRVPGERTVSASKPFTSGAVFVGLQEVMELLARRSSTRIGSGSTAWEYVWSCSLSYL